MKLLFNVSHNARIREHAMTVLGRLKANKTGCAF